MCAGIKRFDTGVVIATGIIHWTQSQNLEHQFLSLLNYNNTLFVFLIECELCLVLERIRLLCVGLSFNYLVFILDCLFIVNFCGRVNSTFIVILILLCGWVGQHVCGR